MTVHEAKVAMGGTIACRVGVEVIRAEGEEVAAVAGVGTIARVEQDAA